MSEASVPECPRCKQPEYACVCARPDADDDPEGKDAMSDEHDPMKDPMAELAEGYKCYRDWAEAMAAAGQPLPPGGTCMVTRQAVFTGRLLDLRLTIAAEMGIPAELVRVDLDVHPLHRHLTPKIEIDLPDDYHAPSGTAEEYARGVIATFYERFQKDVNGRLAAMARSERPDLMPEIAEAVVDRSDPTPAD